ncbi:trichohyalin-like [Malaya genurostris]|uniref:trichohyalin-like n=1 Tax=Malaya genurostris TaxID=325434 RepID=UPI0026F4052B|nr:trichohyalin-like [Malaya genurostris]
MPGGFDFSPNSSKSVQAHRNVHDDADDDGDGEVGTIIPDRTGKHIFCRLCLTHSGKLRALFPPDSAPDPSLLAQIFNCVEVQITLPYDIKSFICADCIQQIYSFANFKELCKSNDQLLKSQTFTQDSYDEESEDEKAIPNSSDVAIIKKELDNSFITDVSLLEKLLEQGVEVEAIGQTINSNPQFEQTSPEDREAERKAKNAARMRRWRMRQRQKQEQQLIEAQKNVHKIEQDDQPSINHSQLEQEKALRLQQAQDLFALFAQHQLRKVEAEIHRFKEESHNQQLLNEQLEYSSFTPEPPEENTVSRQSSPTSDKHMTSLRRSRAEYMRKWRAKRQTQQNTASFGFVGRPPTVSPPQSESEKLLAQRYNRAEYMRRWRRERLRQELSPEEFDEWCVRSEQRRRFREWQVVKESGASSTGDDTVDCGERDTEKSCSLEAIRFGSIQS